MSAARSRLEHAISEGQLLSSLDNASSIRDDFVEEAFGARAHSEQRRRHRHRLLVLHHLEPPAVRREHVILWLPSEVREEKVRRATGQVGRVGAGDESILLETTPPPAAAAGRQGAEQRERALLLRERHRI